MASDRRNFWFAAAWVLLVLAVSFGFWVQAKTIHSLHETQDTQRRLLVEFEKQRAQDIAAICDLTFTQHPEQVDEARRVLARYDIECPPAGEQGGG